MKKLTQYLGIGALALGLYGCQPGDLSLKTDELHVRVLEQTPKGESIFQDLNGDGKKDIVYYTEIEDRTLYRKYNLKEEILDTYPQPCKFTEPIKAHSSKCYETYVKLNLGDGEFSKPKLIIKTLNRPEGMQELY